MLLLLFLLEEQKKLTLTSNVIHNNGDRRISYITWNEASKSFLPCSIPVELKQTTFKICKKKRVKQHLRHNVKSTTTFRILHTRAANEPFDLQGTLFLTKSQYQLSPEMQTINKFVKILAVGKGEKKMQKLKPKQHDKEDIFLF